MKRAWTKGQINSHKEAAHKLGRIKNEIVDFIASNKHNIYEGDVLKFIKSTYNRHNLINDHKKEYAIIAFGRNTKEVHYFPKARGDRLKPNSLILLDMWAKLNVKDTPYADMTWMLWYGAKIPKAICDKWHILRSSRDKALTFIKDSLSKRYIPKGFEIDRISHDEIGNSGYGEAIKHTVGHSLGFNSPHGDLPSINWKQYSPILKNISYTIEPGMYFDKYGMRTEIDFYISSTNSLIVTTLLQDQIEIIK